MKVRIKFQKYGAMKFIGHLDVMRYFQKAFRRAGFDCEYSKGFNPHQIMSFAAPLGLGLTSDGEYVDISLQKSESPEIMVKKLNEVMSEGFRVTGFHVLKDPKENEKHVTAMSLVSSADYIVSLKDGYSLGEMDSQDSFKEAFKGFYEKNEITILKKTKTSEKLVDIKPMITMVAFSESEYKEKLKEMLFNIPLQVNDEKHYSTNAAGMADVYEQNIKVYLQLDTGSAANLKPELVIEAFCNNYGIDFNPYAWQVHRLELYTRDEKTKKIIPLDMLDK